MQFDELARDVETESGAFLAACCAAARLLVFIKQARDIFRRVGLTPVFFARTVIGAHMPNLTYMLGFESPEELKANWSKFGGDPGWIKLKGMPEYADKAILSGITNVRSGRA